MSLEAVREVKEAHSKAEAMLAEQARKARSLAAEAEEAGAALLTDVQKEAAQKNERLLLEADSEASGEALVILQNAEKDCDALRSSAKGRIAAAAERIVERIVSG